MKRFFAAVFLLLSLAFPTLAQVQGTAMRSTNGIGFGTTTIRGNLQATNTISTNRIHGKLLVGNTNISLLGTETLIINSRATNPAVLVQGTRSALSVGHTVENASMIHNGIVSVVQISTNNTADWVNSSYPQLAGFNVTIQPESGSSGMIRRVAGYASTIAGASPIDSGATFQEGVGYWFDTASAGNNLSNIVALKASGLNAGWNNCGVWLGIVQNSYPPTGNWALWDETGYPSKFSGVVHGNAAGVSNAVTLIAGTCVSITTNADGRTFTISGSGSGQDFLTNNRSAATLSGLTLNGITTNGASGGSNWVGGISLWNPATGKTINLTNGNVTIGGVFTGNGSGLTNIPGTALGTTWGGISNVAASATNIIVANASTTIQNGSTNTLTVVSGRVGIGTTLPVAQLQVGATGFSLSADTIQSIGARSIYSSIAGLYTGQLSSVDTTSMAAGVGGSINFIGTYNAGNALTWLASIAGVKENGTDGNYAGNLVFNTRINGSAATEKMRIVSTGNVGIGTTTPAQLLSVNGSGIFSNTLSVLNSVSTTQVKVGGVLKTDVTAVGNLGGGADNLISYTIPASQLGANGESFEFDVWGYCTNNVNTKQITVNYGGTALIDTTALVLNGVSWKAHGRIVRTGAATQTANCEFTVGGTLLSAVNGTITLTTAPAETLSGTVVFKCTGTSAGSPNDNDIVQTGMSLKWLPNGN